MLQVGLLSLLLCSLGADSPPTPKKEEDVEARIARSFTELADGDAKVRDAARSELMGLERRYLPELKRIVEQSKPLLPSQAAVLRQIVTHIYLSGEPYPVNHAMGFLGVRMQSATVSQPVDPQVGRNPQGPEANIPAPLPQNGVVIVERLAGFVGARALLDGDVIVAIEEHPQVQFASSLAFSQAIASTAPGETIHFQVLRRGRVVKVEVKLDSRPAAAEDADQSSMDALDTQRRQKADGYWRETFAPLVQDKVG
jgi:hypothetical protein